jgi:hypothetical protein
MKHENRGLLVAILNGENAKKAFRAAGPVARSSMDEMLYGHVPDHQMQTTVDATLKNVHG